MSNQQFKHSDFFQKLHDFVQRFCSMQPLFDARFFFSQIRLQHITQPKISTFLNNDRNGTLYTSACHICFHQKSTTLAYVLEVTVIHSLYVQM